jgi:hypothetical protein
MHCLVLFNSVAGPHNFSMRLRRLKLMRLRPGSETNTLHAATFNERKSNQSKMIFFLFGLKVLNCSTVHKMENL